MLHRVKELTGDTIAASDGEIGRVDEVYFDDEGWRVRYLVVDTGGWLAGRKVLISPIAIDRSRSTESAIAVGLTREQVEHSPGIDADKPPDAKAVRELKQAERKAGESHLRASGEVIGYSIQAADGAVGHLDDLVVDDRNWAIADLVVDTRNWLPGKKVLVSPSAVEEVDWRSREVKLRMDRREVEQRAPAA
jgi:sporulation protein YlmC with PRC-barrel domain